MFKSFLETSEKATVKAAVEEALEQEKTSPYSTALQAIYSFCRANSDRLMVEACREGMSTMHTVYSPNPYKHALAIANDVARVVAGPELDQKTSNGNFVALGAPDESFWVTMRTELEHQRFVISYRMRIVARVVRGQMCARFAVKVGSGCSTPPPEYDLARMNFDLISPGKEGEWAEIEERERALSEKFVCRISDIRGGKKQKRDLRGAVFMALTESHVPDLAMAGYWAAKSVAGFQDDVKGTYTVPVVLSASPELVARVLGTKLGVHVELRERMLKIPGFARLRRHGVYVVSGEKTFLVAEVINLPQYDVVPMASGKHNLAHARVIVFVLYLEAWVKETLCKPSDPMSRIVPFCAWARVVAKKIRDSGKLEEKYETWIGYYEPMSTWIKDKMLSGKRYFPYFPGMWKLKNGAFKTF